MSAHNSDKKFLLSCVDPFHPSAKGVALPSGSATASYKSSAVIRCDGQLDPAGNGVILFNPSVARDAGCIWFQQIGNNAANSMVFPFNTNIVPNSSYSATGSDFQNPAFSCFSANSLPFSIEDVIGGPAHATTDNNSGNPVTRPPNVRGRVVSAGLKITFSGSTLNDAGVVYALTEPTHDSFQFQTFGNSLAQYTSTKVQRMSLRNTIELVAFPTTRAQQEFTNAYDDLVVNYSAGVQPLGANNGSAVCGFRVARFQVTKNGTTLNSGLGQSSGTGANNSATFCDTAGYECPNIEKALISSLYPLSRRNAQKFTKAFNIGTCTVANSIITWTSSAPASGAIGAVIIVAGNSNKWILGFNGTTWYCIDPILGVPSYDLNITSAGTVFAWIEHVTPPPVGCVLIQGGAAMAGQTYHIEYVVHVEYSGIGVQGRTSANVPNEHVMDLTLSAIDHARETCGQHESANLKHVALACVEHIAAKHAPQLVQVAADVVGGALGGPAGAVFGDVAGGLVGQALKRIRH